ncbi:FAD/NAD-P-binding domain-containing protein [Rhodocollybia butyracea]|uniref:FAD/NAD-P-binding domain-containing protein n=1 Tax=Rhodocollybia butyracea TaxID=206335 RepID=A0A9P5Q115_9AGAR|nr:FAD/NAD-P-binding domain-containing protein [Rhodocollybia butyracea]
MLGDVTRIAIVGGGIGGLSAAISLRRLPNVDVQIFEQTGALREVGASIALGPNGLRGLEEMGAINALDGEIAFRSEHGYPMVYRHWKTNEILVKDEHSPSVYHRRHHTARYFRPHLQQALAENVPPDNLHLGKHLVNVTIRHETDDGAVLDFEDGSQYSADLVIAADGISSTVRSTFLPEHKLSPTGLIALRAVFDVSHIQDLIKENQNYRNLFWSMMGKGKFTVVGLGYDGYLDKSEGQNESPWKGKIWDDEGNVEKFREVYKDWHPSITALLDRVPPGSMRVHPGRGSNEIPVPVHAGRIALLGDAFHPHGGALAAGGSLAIDDSIALFLSLQYVQQLKLKSPNTNGITGRQTPSLKLSASELSRALDLYAATRLSHVSRVFDVVERMKEGVARPGKRWDEEKIQMWARNKTEVVWLHEHDVHKAFEDAIELSTSS